MDGATLQTKIYAGYGQAAKRIGFNCQLYRPASPLNPLQSASIATLPASFTDNGFRFTKPNEYGDPTWMGLFNGNQTQPGDILVGPQGMFFIAAMQKTLPIYCIQAERLVSVLRVVMDSAVGAIGYGGDTPATEQVLMSGWPASILQGTKGETNEAKLPGDVRVPWWIVLMPAWPGLVLRTSDIITDDLGRKYAISSAELTDMGWRMTARQEQV